MILIRHGQSIWNAENRFTGWTDVELSDQGINEAEDAGLELKEVKIDVIHTSDLIRAKKTAEIVLLENSASVDVEIKTDWRLNERTMGLCKDSTKRRLLRSMD